MFKIKDNMFKICEGDIIEWEDDITYPEEGSTYLSVNGRYIGRIEIDKIYECSYHWHSNIDTIIDKEMKDFASYDIEDAKMEIIEALSS